MARSKGLVKEELINNIISMIIHGTLNEGDFLPSIRSMSTFYNISRGTVLVVYKHLESMGYIQGIERSGYIVVKKAYLGTSDYELPLNPPTAQMISTDEEESTQQHLTKLYQRKPCKLPAQFIKRWASNYDNFLQQNPSFNLYSLQRFLKLSRGITVDEKSLLLLSGYQESLGLIALFLQEHHKKKIILEDPCSPKIKELFAQFQFDIISVATDSDGLLVDQLPDITDVALLCMPTLQYPTATRLSEDRKQRLYRWAAKRRIIIIEDDSYAMLGFGKNISPPLYLCQKQTPVIYLTQLIEVLGSTYNLAIITLPPMLVEPFRRLNQALHSNYPPASFSIIDYFLSSSYLMKYLTTLVEERQAKTQIAKIICTERLPTHSINFQENGGFCSFSLSKSNTPKEFVNTAFFPITPQWVETSDERYFLFPHTLMSLSELEKLSRQLLPALAT
ncbi:aminotransferase class I/II-fold pyridoxal phosphate-dependent enzyme [Rosenbergiella metrosideri]|uniref:aminotransferase class I/II-fold pyridoxal phosphate-dependent enzyme n=1 Tax=Rosenbergiella metrosideri TaxID=2921185 RepID=UPI001F4F1B00|nr:PLP-dependent aminotransferase family protein [Rosenbergiella metrosideri]